MNIELNKLPSRSVSHKFADGVFDFLFPVESEFHIWHELREDRIEHLKQTLKDLISHSVTNEQELSDKADNFFNALPQIHEQLLADLHFFLLSDPAAENEEEIILAYPGFFAIAIYRISNLLYKSGIRVLPRVLTEYAHSKTGIDIHPGATIGSPFFIDHGTGIVIGQTTVVGQRVKMYQGVTLGALAVRKENDKDKRHPTIEDDVILYAGSCILGGDTTVGHDSVIGGNVWLTNSVPPLSIVYHKSDVHIRDKSEMKEIIDFVI